MKRVKGEICRLSDLKVGQLGKVISIQIPAGDLKRHLLEMGLIQDTVVKVKKIAPLGEPIVVELRGYELFLEKKQLKRIYVEVI